MRAEVVARHQADQRVGRLANPQAGVGERIGDLRITAALPVDAATDAQLAPVAAQAVLGVQLQHLVWMDGGDRLAVRILGPELGPADAGAPAARQFAAQFHFVAFGPGAVHGQPGLLARIGHEPAFVGDGEIVLLDLEHGKRGVQLAVQEFAFDARFIVLAFQRIQINAAAVAHGLRIEDIGIAGVQRSAGADVDHRADIGRDHAAMADAVGLVGPLADIAVARPVGDAAANDQLEGIGQLQARRAVHAGLGVGRTGAGVVRPPLRLRIVAVPGAEVADLWLLAGVADQPLLEVAAM